MCPPEGTFSNLLKYLLRNKSLFVSDQERVLQKSVHVLDFGGVPLVLTVRSTPGPSTDPPITKLDPTSSQVRVESLLK